MSKQAVFTPPSKSLINTPLTPPTTESKHSLSSSQVYDIIRYLHFYQAGGYVEGQSWIGFQLFPADFEKLLALLKADELLWAFVEDCLRYDYFSSRNRFVIRMPTRTHEFFTARIVSEIAEQLRRIEITGGDDAAAFAKDILWAASPRFEFPNSDDTERTQNSKEDTKKYDTHDPDAVFEHLEACWPGVVIEVSFSQKQKDLKYLAENYILGSDGNIRVVVGLDIEYKKSKRATLSIWQPQYVLAEDGQEELVSMQTVVDKEFRDELGNRTDGLADLQIELKDFAPTKLTKNVQATTLSIFISSSTLYDFLAVAEAKDAKFKLLEGEKDQMKPGTRKRHRVRTPPEELKSEDERKFQKQEDEDSERAAGKDSDYE